MHRTIKVVGMMPSQCFRRISVIHRSVSEIRMFDVEPYHRGSGMNVPQNVVKPQPLSSSSSLHMMIRYFSSTSTSMTEDEIQRRLSIFKDLYVVARDCMEDLVNAQGSESDENDDDNDDNDNDEFVRHVAYVQDSVEAALNEFNNLMKDLPDNHEQRNRLIKSHGFKIKQLELELALMLQNVTDEDDDDENIKSNREIQDDKDDDDGDNEDEDDLEYEDENDDDDDPKVK